VKSRAPIMVVLSLALAFGAGAAFRWWWWTHFRQSTASGHALSNKQIMTLATFDRRCFKHRDCEPPLSCVLDIRIPGRRCLGHECDSNADCQLGFVCRAVETDGRAVRLCLVEGIKKVGELCEGFPLKPKNACEGELLCNHQFCGQRCRLDDPDSCPEYFTCLQNRTLDPSCVPSCLRGGCPGGKRCFQFEGDFSVCGVLDGDTDCEANPCPPDMKCSKGVHTITHEVYMGCVRPCDESHPCPRGSFCPHGICREECDAKVRGSCGPNRTCVYDRSLRKGFCVDGL
jgi:hypothetical protein